MHGLSTCLHIVLTASELETRMHTEADPQLRFLLSPVLEWLDDPLTEEVAINRPGEAFVRQSGVFAKHPLALTYDDLEDIAILAGALRKQDVGPRNPVFYRTSQWRTATDMPAADGSVRNSEFNHTPPRLAGFGLE